MQADSQQVNYRVNVDGNEYGFGAVSMGNPHCVLTVDDVAMAPVDKLGGQLTEHNLFPEGANIGFMQVLAHDEIRLRVFERGVGETQAGPDRRGGQEAHQRPPRGALRRRHLDEAGELPQPVEPRYRRHLRLPGALIAGSASKRGYQGLP